MTRSELLHGPSSKDVHAAVQEGCRRTAESFFHTLKTELVYHEHYRSREAARLATIEWIEGFYNRTRLHSTLGYRSPEEYETIASFA